MTRENKGHSYRTLFLTEAVTKLKNPLCPLFYEITEKHPKWKIPCGLISILKEFYDRKADVCKHSET